MHADWSFELIDARSVEIIKTWFKDVELARRLSPLTPEWVAHVSSAGQSRAWTARRAGRLVGWVQLEVYPEGHDAIAIAVDPDQRGLGLGRGMLRAFLALPERGKASVIVGFVEPDNYSARAAAESAGFVLANSVPDADNMLRFEHAPLAV